MDEWLSAEGGGESGQCVKVSEEATAPSTPVLLVAGHHQWYASSHARPTYCNVCRDALSGVTSHGLSCEVCKAKVHKRCAPKAIANCKWTTLSSVGKDIIEDADGNITMPHQWMEGNLPVSAKCAVCERTCGSVLRLQDWRCLWCRAVVHTACRPALCPACPLGPARVSVVPPTALHAVQDEAWEAVRPQASSPLLVFVNSKSGDNQGIKFLRRFKQLLNPAQVFDLMSAGPRLGLRLFRHFDPFRILVCSGDGSVGWVLSEIDKLDMHRQCQVAVLPLGTGNDLARVLGWGSSCDDDAHLPQLLERYERAGTKMLDRWSIMTYERTIAMPKLSLSTTQPSGDLHDTMLQYEGSLVLQLHTILQSDETSVVLNAARHLCDTVKDLATQIAESALARADRRLVAMCELVDGKLDSLLETLTREELDCASVAQHTQLLQPPPSQPPDDDGRPPPLVAVADDAAIPTSTSTTSLSSAETAKQRSEKLEKDLNNFKSRSRRRSKFVERESLMMRSDSLKRAVRQLMEHVEQAIDEQNQQPPQPPGLPTIRVSTSGDLETEEAAAAATANRRTKDTLKVDVSPSPSPSPTMSRLTSISPMPDLRRDSTCDDGDDSVLNVPVPTEFADGGSRRSSRAPDTFSEITVIHVRMCPDDGDRDPFSEERKAQEQEEEEDVEDDDRAECSSLMSAMSNEEASIVSCDAAVRSFSPRKNSAGDDENGHINHIDSPETDTFPNSEALQGGESLMDDISSLLAMTIGCGDDDDSDENTSYTDDTTLFAVEHERPPRASKKRRPGGAVATQCGFENPAFAQSEQQVKYCSLAHFVEGNDIARRSFKKSAAVKSKAKSLKPEQEAPPEATAPAETVMVFPQMSVIVEPPSPISSEQTRRERLERLDRLEQQHQEATGAGATEARHLDPEHMQFLSCSPAATRRISSGSLLRAGESATLLAAEDPQQQQQPHQQGKQTAEKRLPIINPLVRLPSWPHVNGSVGPGFISQCLLANADALCAAVSPLMDPDETLLEGFYERCVMNNYFGIGIDAKISLDFHHKREEHPEKCRSRAKNYMWYGVLGSKQWLQKTFKNLEQRVQLECDGQRIPLPSLQGIVILNIPSFMGGTNFWGGRKEDDIFLAPSFDDRILEVVAVFGSVQMAASRLINLQRHRIAQCQTIQINILGDEGVPVQVDGEAWIQPPGMIRIIHKNRMQMMCRNRGLEESLRAWEEKQRSGSIAAASAPTSAGPSQPEKTKHDKGAAGVGPGRRPSLPRQQQPPLLGVPIIADKGRHHSITSVLGTPAALGPTPATQDDWLPEAPAALPFSDDERRQLLHFLECSTSLAKWVKILSVAQGLDTALYALADRTDACLEAVHPSGKILEGVELRVHFTKLVHAVKSLYEECCFLLHQRRLLLDRQPHPQLPQQQQHGDLEEKLAATLATVEMELRKCFTMETASAGNLVFLHLPSHHQHRPSPQQQFRSSKSGAAAGPADPLSSGGGASQQVTTGLDVASWGTQEVSTWLDALQLSEYVESFVRNDVRGRELLTLARRDLKDLGVTKVGHVKRILQAVKDLGQGKVH